MGSLKVCRICLAINMRMHELTDVLLNKFISVIGSDLQEIYIKQYACYKCAALINKFCEFRTRCLASQSILDDILDTCGRITEDHINLVDRDELKLTLGLSHHMLPTVVIAPSSQTGDVEVDSDWDEKDDVPLLYRFKEGETSEPEDNNDSVIEEPNDDSLIVAGSNRILEEPRNNSVTEETSNDSPAQEDNNDSVIEEANNYCQTDEASDFSLAQEPNNDSVTDEANNYSLVEEVNNYSQTEEPYNDLTGEANNNILTEEANSYCIIEQSYNYDQTGEANNNRLTFEPNNYSQTGECYNYYQTREPFNYYQTREANNNSLTDEANNYSLTEEANNYTLTEQSYNYSLTGQPNNYILIEDPNYSLTEEPNNYDQIGEVYNYIVIKEPNNYSLTENPNSDIVLEEANNDILVEEPNNDVLLEEANNDSLIEEGNNVSLTEDDNNDSPTEDTNNDSPVEDSNNDSPVEDANNDSPIEDANNDSSVEDVNNDSLTEEPNNDDQEISEDEQSGQSEEFVVKKKRSEKFSWLKDFNVTNLTISEQKEEIKKRKDSPNYLNSPFTCEICNRGYLRRQTLNNHMYRHDVSSGAIVCEVCQFRFKTKKIYLFHIARHSKQYSCKKCHFITTQPDAARKHKKWHDNDNYECVYCDQIYTNLKVYLNHLKSKHKSQHLCDDCGYSFVSRKGLKLHVSVMHKDAQLETGPNTSDSSKKLFCKVCNIKLNSKTELKRHVLMSAKHKHDLFKGCRRCTGAQCSRETHLPHVGPVSSVTPVSPALSYSEWVEQFAFDTYPASCQYCGDTMINRIRHWKHRQQCFTNRDGTTSRKTIDKTCIHNEIHMCEECGQGFTNKASLLDHQRVHNIKRYKCPLCELSFESRQCYRLHVRSHPAHSLHTCRTCQLMFSSSQRLRRHEAIHTGALPCPRKSQSRKQRRSSQNEPHILEVHKKVVRDVCI